MKSRYFKKQNVQFVLGLCLGLSLTAVLRMLEGTSSLVYVRGKRDNSLLSEEINQVCAEVTVKSNSGNESPATLRTHMAVAKIKAVHVKNTWAKRCNKVFFMSSVRNESFPTIGLNVSEGREHLTAKTMKAFKYLYTNHLQDADWFLKADDDTFVIMENLRYFLSDEDPQEPVYFGQRFKPIVRQGYTSGGGGYVLSKEALRRFGSEGVDNPKLCAMDNGAEDVQMGICLQNVGVRLKPSVDVMGRSRFHCFSPETMLKRSFPNWYKSYDSEGAKGGIENISDYAVSFHYVPPDKMYALEFYTYHLQPYGVLNHPQALNVKS